MSPSLWAKGSVTDPHHRGAKASLFIARKRRASQCAGGDRFARKRRIPARVDALCVFADLFRGQILLMQVRSAKAHAVDRRQIVGDGYPVVATILTDIEIARGAAKRDGVAADAQRMTIDDVVCVFLGQSLAELLPGIAAIFCAADKQSAADRHALLIGNARHDPGGLTIMVVRRDRKSEMNTLLWLTDLLPSLGAIRAVEHAAVVLLPDMLRRARATLNEVRIMPPFRVRIGQVVIGHALIATLPGLSTIIALQDARSGDRDAHPLWIAGVHINRVDAWSKFTAF